MADNEQPVDPRRPIVEVMARLGRETQLHLDEREHHFKITDAVITAISVVLIILAIFNVYYVRVLYTDLENIVGTMQSMLTSLERVDEDMQVVAGHVAAFDRHITHMDAINAHVSAVTQRLPQMRADMDLMTADMAFIEADMHHLAGAVGSITPGMVRMTQSMALMRHNVRQIAKPMGSMNPVLP